MDAVIKTLLDCLASMDVPVNRKLISLDNPEASLANLRWLNRNMAIRNSGNPNMGCAVYCVHHLLARENEFRSKANAI